MFDNYSFSLFNELPSLPEINIGEIRRLLSKAYIYSIKMRLGLVQEDFNTIDLETLSEEELDRIEEEIDEESFTLFNELYYELRRLGDTLESSAVFDNVENENSVKSASFVAAESLSLLATLLKREEETNQIEEVLFSNELIYTRTEAAMLFLISGYDANAQTEINEVLKIAGNPQHGDSKDNLYKIEYWCLHNLIALFTNNLWNVKREKPDVIVETNSKSLKNLIKENKFQMYSLIGDSILSYINWLTGENNEGLRNSLELLTKINHSSYKSKYALYPEVYHFSKVLMVMIKETSKRSLFHNTPLPVDETFDFIEYLKGRTKGAADISSRPFIWESAKEFISECLPGPSKHTIVNLPTGSGKSFIAELAVAHSLSNGWILYLAPTNALVHQIKRDLKKSLQFFGDFR
ncbi:MAG: DEAD/DEAH box helicase [Bacillota bacterium]